MLRAIEAKVRPRRPGGRAAQSLAEAGMLLMPSVLKRAVWPVFSLFPLSLTRDSLPL